MKPYYSIFLMTLPLLLPIDLSANEMAAEDNYVPTLITETPYEGRQLAIKMVRKTIGTIQTDAAAKHRVRAKYAEDPALLMDAAELVAIEFKTIAIANDYWRE